MTKPLPTPYNDMHLYLNRGKWCACGVPIWRRGIESPDRCETFDNRSRCRVCSLKTLSSQWVRDEDDMREALERDSTDERLQGIQDAVALMPFDSHHLRKGDRERWAMTEMGKAAANRFIPLPDVWNRRQLPERGSSTHIGYTARHALEVRINHLERAVLQTRVYWPLDDGPHHFVRPSDARSFPDIRDAPDSDWFVTDEPAPAYRVAHNPFVIG